MLERWAGAASPWLSEGEAVTGGHDGRIDVPALTGLRAIAAWWVVAYHVRNLFSAYASPEMMGFLAAGYTAVDLFFILSGFVIYLNYAPRLTPTRASVADFAVRRLARIYPLHLLILLAMVGYVFVLWQFDDDPLNATYSLQQLALHLLLVQGWGFTDLIGWNIPSWSISTEALAYLSFPLIAFLGGWQRRPTWLLIAAPILVALLLHAVFEARGDAKLGDDIPANGLVRCILQFAIGTMLCELYLRWRHRGAGLSVVLLGATTVLVGGFVAFGWPETLAIPLAWTTLVLGLALWPWERFNVLAARPLVYLGDISYSTYLVHYFAFILFKHLFIPTWSSVTPATAILFFAIVFLLSALLYRGFERPAQRWVIDRWKQRSAGRPRPKAQVDAVGDVRG